MRAVEINAGAWYLRALRHDDRLSDVPALTALGVPDPVAYVTGAEDHRAGASDAEAEAEAQRCVWGVCIPTTGEVIALIGVDTAGRLRGVARPGYEGALADAQGPVQRYAQGALGLTVGPLSGDIP